MRVLFLTHRLPYAPNRGDRIRAFHMLEGLSSRAEVELVSLVHDADEAARAEDLRGVVANVSTVAVPRRRNLLRAATRLPTGVPLTHLLLDAPGLHETLREICARRPPDIVFAYCSGMARFALEPPLAGLPFVLDLVDVDSQKWLELADRTPPPMRWIYRREARQLARFEAHAATAAVATLVVNEREAVLARRLAPSADVHVVSNGIDVASFRPQEPPSSRARVVFCGVLDYAPNDEGAGWFARDVWPLVRQQRPDATLTLVGPNPTRRLRSACAADPTIELTGQVADVRPYLWSSAVAVAPLHVARGMQNKVLEALASGLPPVVTSAVAAGLPRDVLPACSVAETASAFAANVLQLLALSPDRRRARASRASLQRLEWRTTSAALWSILSVAPSHVRNERLVSRRARFKSGSSARDWTRR